MTEEQFEKQLKKLKRKIPYNEHKYPNKEDYEQKMEDLLDDALNIALSTLYPFIDDYTGIELPTKYYNWQIRACIELYSNGGIAGVKTYSENSLAWSRDNDNCISNALLDELVPKVGIPKRSKINDN